MFKIICILSILYLFSVGAELDVAGAFKVLNLSPDANSRDVKLAYYDLARKHHSDTTGNNNGLEQMKHVNNAKDIITEHLYKMEMKSQSNIQRTSSLERTSSSPLERKSDIQQITSGVVNNMKGPLLNLGVIYTLHFFGNKAAPTVFKGEISNQIVLSSVAKTTISTTVVPKMCSMVNVGFTGQVACQIVSSIGTSLVIDNSLEKSMIREAIDTANKEFDTNLNEATSIQLKNAAKIPIDMKSAMNGIIDIFINEFSKMSNKYSFKRNNKSGMVLFLEGNKICEIHAGDNLIVSISDDISKLKSFSKYLTINFYRNLEGVEVQIKDRLSNKLADAHLYSQLDKNILTIVDYTRQIMKHVIKVVQ